MGFGADLRKIRIAKGYSLRRFAKEINLSATYVSKIERETFPPCSAEVIARMARLLSLNPDIICLKARKTPRWISNLLYEKPDECVELLKKIKGL